MDQVAAAPTYSPFRLAGLTCTDCSNFALRDFLMRDGSCVAMHEFGGVISFFDAYSLYSRNTNIARSM